MKFIVQLHNVFMLRTQGSNLKSAKIFFQYHLVCEQYRDRTHLVIKQGISWRPMPSTTKKFIVHLLQKGLVTRARKILKWRFSPSEKTFLVYLLFSNICLILFWFRGILILTSEALQKTFFWRPAIKDVSLALYWRMLAHWKNALRMNFDSQL